MGMSTPSARAEPGPIRDDPAEAHFAPDFIAQIRARVPHRLCCRCGESIGAARLTLWPETPLCAWCASLERPADPARRGTARTAHE